MPARPSHAGGTKPNGKSSSSVFECYVDTTLSNGETAESASS